MSVILAALIALSAFIMPASDRPSRVAAAAGVIETRAKLLPMRLAEGVNVIDPSSDIESNLRPAAENSVNLRLGKTDGFPKAGAVAGMQNPTLANRLPFLRDLVILPQGITGQEILSHKPSLRGGALSVILDHKHYLAITQIGWVRNAFYRYAEEGPQLPFGGITSERVRLNSQPNRDRNGNQAQDVQPSREAGGIGRLPLGAKIGIAAVIALFAWLCLFRAVRPFGLLAFNRRDVGEGISYRLLGFGLIACSFCFWGWR